ncbi:hypothetical protein PSPO_b0285 [Pseudoalteromonas spongiae UST010723-006]|nr:hypothetical protein PSPO_b0285 [Pseudoalteromonas spongiae UST010723-006]
MSARCGETVYIHYDRSENKAAIRAFVLSQSRIIERMGPKLAPKRQWLSVIATYSFVALLFMAPSKIT